MAKLLPDEELFFYVNQSLVFPFDAQVRWHQALVPPYNVHFVITHDGKTFTIRRSSQEILTFNADQRHALARFEVNGR